MPIFNCILTTLREIKWQIEDRSQPGDYWLRSGRFPNLRIKSPVANPFGKPWAISIKEEYGKNREREHVYILNCRLTLRPLEKGIEPDCDLVWLYDCGKCLELDRAFLAGALHCFVFSHAPMGWLALLVRTRAIAPVPPAVAPVAPVPRPVPQVKTPKIAPDSDGAAAVNAEKNNDDRREEAIEFINDIVSVLKREQDWDSLKIKQRMKLIQAKAKELRGVSVSSQTLYREWMKPIWQG